MFPRLPRSQILLTAATLVAGCDPNVVIGARWGLGEAGSSGQAVAGAPSNAGSGAAGAGGMVGIGGTEAVAGSGAAGGSDAGAPSAGAAGAPPVDEWCVTAPWQKPPAQFTGDAGNEIPAGDYVITYVSGGQIHDLDIGYEVTSNYFGMNALKAGHHIYNGESPESSPTSLWLDETGLVHGGTLAAVEAANRGHTWPLKHTGGELFITLYDDDYHDNVGPGSRFCVTAAVP